MELKVITKVCQVWRKLILYFIPSGEPGSVEPPFISNGQPVDIWPSGEGSLAVCHCWIRGRVRPSVSAHGKLVWRGASHDPIVCLWVLFHKIVCTKCCKTTCRWANFLKLRNLTLECRVHMSLCHGAVQVGLWIHLQSYLLWVILYMYMWRYIECRPKMHM